MNSPSVMESANTWIELSTEALVANIGAFRRLANTAQMLMCVVKSNAYGHGLVEIAREVMKHNADWLGVFSVQEGLQLRTAGINCPILVMGPIPDASTTRTALENGLRLTVVSEKAAQGVAGMGVVGARIHLKIETGTHRQGIELDSLEMVLRTLMDAKVEVEGAYTHYADIEDTTDHTFAQKQLAVFHQALNRCRELGVPIPVPHTACSAAAILFPDTCFRMIRIGIALYGLWPSRETLVSAKTLGRSKLSLSPVLTWKTRIAQLKDVPKDAFVGYGRTFRATRNTRMAVLPTGYADGYCRAFSNAANVLVRGMRARVIGRVCMNLTMVDVTDIPDATTGDEVVLLGRSGDETITAEDLARIAGTIHYEIVTRAATGAPRIWVR